MMQYLVILLDDTSVSYCHCDNPYKESRLISLDDLKAGILYAMKENLMIQFVYPNYELPQEYLDVIDTIDHHDIVPCPMKGDVAVIENSKLGAAKDEQKANVFAFSKSSCVDEVKIENLDGAVVVLRMRKADLFVSGDTVAAMLRQVQRLNVVITDLETFIDEELKQYDVLLDQWAAVLKEEYLKGRSPQLNLLTDRMMLTKPNHCNAGVENITLAPNGKFYLCPAFYYSGEDESVGDLANGLYVKNQQLLCLDHAATHTTAVAASG